MERIKQKNIRLKRRIVRVKHAIMSRKARPRLVFNRTNRYLAATIVDDSSGKVLCAVTTSGRNYKEKSRKDKGAAAMLGETVAKLAVEKGVSDVVLDRRGRLYHGRIASFAEAARKSGLKF